MWIQDFPEGAPPTKVGVLTYYFAKIFCRKLHENERIWTPRGADPWCPPPPVICQWLSINTLRQENNFRKQESIPVGCEPPACCPFLPACTAGPGGVCLWSGGCLPLVGGCLLLVQGDACLWSVGVVSGGVASHHALRQTPTPTPVNRMTDRQV